MELYIMKFILKGCNFKSREIPKLRGYLAGKFPEYTELHNHLSDDRFMYGYPMIQYKTINNIPNIIAINNAALTLYHVMNEVDNISINENLLEKKNRYFVMDKYNYGIANEKLSYKFISPWMALNQENYKKYIQASDDDRNELLKKILVGNILSMSKYLDYKIENELSVEINLNPIDVNYKNRRMLTFKGSFSVNFFIPDYMGIGKSVSRGFGMIESDFSK